MSARSATGDKLWIVISRPDRLPSAIAAAQALRAYFSGGIHLLREHSKWWERAHWQPYATQFSEVHSFARVESCRGLRDLPRLYHQSVERRQAVAALPINPKADLLLCLGGFLTLSNVAISTHRRVRKILALSDKAYRELTRPSDRTRFRYTTASWFQNRIVEPVAGINRTQRFKPRLNPGGDGVRLERMQRDPEDIYDEIVVLSNNGAEISADRNDRVIGARFPSIAELQDLPALPRPANRRRRVIFFGTPFLLIHNLSPSAYAKHVNACLDFLRRNYPGCHLIYRPHPIETNESKNIDLNGFQVEEDREAAELYFLRNYQTIEAVYSVSSTVSRTALNNGLNGYAMYSLFSFTKQQSEFFAGVMGEVPEMFNIRSLISPPEKYQPLSTATGRSYAEALTSAVAAVYDRRRQAV